MSRPGPASRGRCDAALAFHVVDGMYGQTTLADRTTVRDLLSGPGKMRDGDWTAALYVDEQAPRHNRKRWARSSLGKWAVRCAVCRCCGAAFLGYKRPLSPSPWKAIRGITIPDILEVAVAAVTGRDSSEPVWATNAGHPVSSKLALAQATVHRYRDHNLAWDTSGTNGHFAPFHWQP